MRGNGHAEGDSRSPTTATIRPSWCYSLLLLTAPVFLVAPGLSWTSAALAASFVISAARMWFGMRIVATEEGIVLTGFWRRTVIERSRIRRVEYRPRTQRPSNGADSLHLFVDDFEPRHLRFYGTATKASAFADDANRLFRTDDDQTIRKAKVATAYLHATAKERFDHYRNMAPCVGAALYGWVQLTDQASDGSPIVGVVLVTAGMAATAHQVTRVITLHSWEGSGGAEAVRELDEHRHAAEPVPG